MFAPSTVFWHIDAKHCYHKKHQKLSAQKLLCFSAKNVSEIDPSIGEKNLFKHDH